MPAPDFTDVCRQCLYAHRELLTHAQVEPVRGDADVGTEWLAWAAARDQLTTVREGHVSALLRHPDWPAWHRRCWHDDTTVAMPAVFVWAPVCRLVVAGGRAAPRVGMAS